MTDNAKKSSKTVSLLYINIRDEMLVCQELAAISMF